GDRLAIRRAVPSLDDYRTRHAQARDSAAAGQFVDRQVSHRHRARRANLNRHDAGGQFSFARVERKRGETDEGVGSANLRNPQGSVAEVLGLADECEAAGKWGGVDRGLESKFLV